MSSVMEMYGLKSGDFIIRRLKETVSGTPDIWIPEQVFSEIDEQMYVLGGVISKRNSEILPYKGNEELVGTDNNKWIPPVDSLVAAKFETDSGIEYWKPAVYMGRNDDGKHTVKFSSDDLPIPNIVYVDTIEPLEKHFKLSN